MASYIDVFGQLSLVPSDGAEVSVRADKGTVSVMVPDFKAARQLLRQVPRRHNRRQVLARLQDGLRLSDLKLQVKVSSSVVARLTPRSRGGLVSRLVGLDPMELRLLAIVRAALSLA
jgi:hypothetical protein